MHDQEFKILFGKWMSGEISRQEELQFIDGWNLRRGTDQLNMLLKDSWSSADAVAVLSEERKEQLLSQLGSADDVPLIPRRHFLTTAWFRYAAAVVIILLAAAMLYNEFGNTSQHPGAGITSVSPTGSNINPGYSRAVLTLSSGEQVKLDSAASETISDGKVLIKNQSGRLSYSNYNIAATNTMSTPKGGQYQLTLSDGTRVWLNAASSITYPTMFSVKSRVVIVSGEAYFEVKANKHQPFIVKTSKGIITVLGTAFNVNAYPDEEGMKTSLLDGAVTVNNFSLMPGQAYQNGKIAATDTRQDIAWKNGVFNFNDVSLPVLMRQLSRWYDIDIRYGDQSKNKNRIFNGELSRDLPLSEILNILNDVNIQFRIEGRTLFVE